MTERATRKGLLAVSGVGAPGSAPAQVAQTESTRMSPRLFPAIVLLIVEVACPSFETFMQQVPSVDVDATLLKAITVAPSDGVGAPLVVVRRMSITPGP